MDEPARKKRKTASPEKEERYISPLKQPPRRISFDTRRYATTDSRRRSPLKEPPRRFSVSVSPAKGVPDRSSSPLKESPRRPPRRPSFASPTKASLARGYPGLLQRHLSSNVPATNGRADILARGKEARAFILGEKDDGPMIVVDPQKTTPQAQRTLKRPVAGANLEEEADLPMTPSQRGTDEPLSSRPGLFSSPSKRPPRLRNPVKHSPLPKAPLAVQQDLSDPPLDEPIQSDEEIDQQVQNEKSQPPDLAIEEKKREKARLMKELKVLEEQVSQCTEVISKIQTQPPTYVASKEERESLINLINNLCGPSEAAEEDEAPPISVLLSSFLPFSTRRLPPPKTGPEQSPIASHRPLELDDPLPYLQMFTSFKITTRINLPRGQKPTSSNRVHQKHIIDLIGPQALLTAQITNTIDTLTNTFIDVELLQLSHWADRELGAFVRARAKERDLGNACWAIGSYWEIAKKRAEYWHKCENAFGHLIPGKMSDDTENVDLRKVKKNKKAISRKELNMHLGRDVLVLEDKHVLLQIRWKIVFDWTGEAGSQVDVVPAVPRVWQEADTNNSFKKIPETFTALLQSKGMFAATKTMVALLFSN